MNRQRHRFRSTLRRFIDSEAAGGVILMGSAALALVTANSPYAEIYAHTLETKLGPLSALHWIDDGLMAIFFLLVGLEIKRELLDGHLRQWSARILPGLGALGGMLAPSLIYAAFNVDSPQTRRGWAIPSATDIAFALGVLALLGDRVPAALKVFLTALAILDDLGAILIIALFYAGEPAAGPTLGAGVTLFLLLGLNLFEVRRLTPYLLLGAVLWYCVEKSGVHATLAGVLLAAFIPLRLTGPDPHEHTPLHRLENRLGPFVALLILPLFGFANAGVTIGEGGVSEAVGVVSMGVAVGLFVGKQLGVFSALALAISTGLAVRPTRSSWGQLYGVSVLCGVGFTMSLFIGQIAFDADPGALRATKIGVLAGSLISIALGSVTLWLCFAKKARAAASPTDAAE
uniref:Na+/H+ antiporter NhaA n=1 Tax=Methylosinus sp. Sm6 TaxID=2866948 RepID=UPI001C98FE95|nr:Na+/H+ antiporter NhaA [Methylosinus sp. Sm6]MBY6240174.1 Na+/H+ antiporter NhaA [Methylosinus sp. Sm6]